MSWRKDSRATIDPSEAGSKLIDIVKDTVTIVEEKERESEGEPCSRGVDWSRIRYEMLFLGVFAVDFATQLTLRDSRERLAVLDAYWGAVPHLGRAYAKDDASFQETLEIRLLYYTAAVRAGRRTGLGTEPFEALFWNVGKAFAELYDSGNEIVLKKALDRSYGAGNEDEWDFLVGHLGAATFGNIVEHVGRLLKSFRILLPQ